MRGRLDRLARGLVGTAGEPDVLWVLAWVGALVYLTVAWSRARDLGFSGADLHLGSADPRAVIAHYTGLWGAFRAASWPFAVAVEGWWVPRYPNAWPLGLIIQALGGLLFGLAVNQATGRRRLGLPFALAAMVSPLAPVMYLGLGAPINFLLAALVSYGHAALLAPARSRGPLWLGALFASSTVVSLLTYELSLVFIAATALAHPAALPPTWGKGAQAAVALAAVAVSFGLFAMVSRSPHLGVGGDITAPASAVATDPMNSLEYLRSRTIDAIHWHGHLIASEARKPLSLVVATLVASLAGLATVRSWTSRDDLKRAGPLLLLLSSAFLLQPLLAALGFQVRWRISAKILFLSTAAFIAVVPWLAEWVGRRWIGAVLVGGSVLPLLLLGAGFAGNLQAACVLPAAERVVTEVSPERSGIREVNGVVYHLTLANRVCQPTDGSRDSGATGRGSR